jgi:hypothetical protein
MLAAVENTEMLALDSMEGEAPEVWLCLTTRTATLDMSEFYEARRQVMRAIQRRWRGARYACLLEFTTGYGERSGGARRPHWNLLLKGVPKSAVERWRDPDTGESLHQLVSRIWCEHVDAEPQGQHVGPVNEAGGLMRYIALHFQKESQAPPRGFRGQRFNCSRDYFTNRTRAEMREAARESLWIKRRIHEAHELGLDAEAIEEYVEAKCAERFEHEWRLTHWVPKQPAPTGDEDWIESVPIRLLIHAEGWRRDRDALDRARREAVRVAGDRPTVPTPTPVQLALTQHRVSHHGAHREEPTGPGDGGADADCPF